MIMRLLVKMIRKSPLLSSWCIQCNLLKNDHEKTNKNTRQGAFSPVFNLLEMMFVQSAVVRSENVLNLILNKSINATLYR